MSNKYTVGQLADIISEMPFIGNIESFKEYYGFELDIQPTKEVIVADQGRLAGQMVNMCKCLNCGEEFTTKVNGRYYGLYGEEIECPKCHKKLKVVSSRNIPFYGNSSSSAIKDDAHIFVLKVLDDVIMLGCFIAKFNLDDKDAKVFSDLFKKKPKMILSKSISNWGVFSKRFGFKAKNPNAHGFYTHAGDALNIAAEAIFKTFNQDNTIVVGDYKESMDILGVHTKDELANELFSVKAKKTTKRKTENPSKRYLNIKLSDPKIIADEYRAKNLTATGVIYEQDFNNIKIKFVCPHCGSLSDATVDVPYGKANVKCNHCSKDTNVDIVTIHGRNSYSATNILHVESLDNDLVIRMIAIKDGISIDDNGDIKIEKNENEYLRAFFSSDKIHCISIDNDGEESISNLIEYKNAIGYYYSGPKVIQSSEEIESIVENTFLGKVGFCKVLEGTEMITHRTFGPESFAYQYYKLPYIEILAKSNLKNIVNNICSNSSLAKGLNDKETKPYKILNVSKHSFKEAAKHDFSLSTLNNFDRLFRLDQEITVNDYNALSRLPLLKVQRLIMEGIKAKKIISYLQSCYDYQCIENYEAFSIWSDYLEMANYLKYNLSDKSIKYPNSLKKEHDKAAFAYATIRREIDLEKFKHNAEFNKQYEYAKGELLAICPKTPNEIVAEGVSQHHCVASYVDRVREGRTCIMFIRKKEKEDESYFTVEILDNQIVQVKGKFNCVPKSDVKDFIKSWAAAKHLVIKGY